MGVVLEGTLLSQLSSSAESFDLEEVYQEPAWVASREAMMGRCRIYWVEGRLEKGD